MNIYQTLIYILVASLTNGAVVKIGITHWNDVSGQMDNFLEETAFYTGTAPTPCAAVNASGSQCVGGLVQVVHWLHDNTSFADVNSRNIFRINAGNFMGGESGWFPCVPNGLITYGNVLVENYQPHFTVLGIKEFGAGLEPLLDFIETTNTSMLPVVNTCTSSYSGVEATFCNGSPLPKTLQVYEPSLGQTFQIGLVSFVDPIVERLSSPGKLKFAPVASSIQNVVSGSDLKSFVAIGEGSVALAREILETVPEVKLVILSSAIGSTMNDDEYPILHSQGLIASAGIYGSTVGKLVLNYDTNTGSVSLDTGHLISTERPDQLNKYAVDAIRVHSQLQGYADSCANQILGRTTATIIGGEACWRGECNLGNLVTDAMVHCALTRFEVPPVFPIHAIWHGGALFHTNVTGGSNITKLDVEKWLPLHNRAHLVYIEGRDLRQVFDTSAGGLGNNASVSIWRQLLQISDGIRVYYDTLDTPKVLRIRITENDMSTGVPTFTELNDDNLYFFVIPTFILDGRGLYDFAKEFWHPASFDGIQSEFALDDECVSEYVKAMHTFDIGIQERIWINNMLP